MTGKVFPTLLIIGMLAAAIETAIAGNLRGSVYWTAAAVLNAAVTY